MGLKDPVPTTLAPQQFGAVAAVRLCTLRFQPLAFLLLALCRPFGRWGCVCVVEQVLRWRHRGQSTAQ